MSDQPINAQPINAQIENTQPEQDTGHIDNAGMEADTETKPEAAWFKDLPDELKASKSLRGFKDVTALAQSYLEAQKNVTRKIAIPDVDATEEEWRRFYNKIGRPEDKKYLDERLPEDEEHVKAYEEICYKNGLSKKQGSGLLGDLHKHYDKLQKQQSELYRTESEQMLKNNLALLKEAYGAEYDGKIALMNAALTKFGSRELAGIIEESNYSPALIDMLVKMGETLKPDSLVTGNEAAVITTPEGAKKEIEKLESDKEFMVKYKDKSSQGHEEAVSKLEKLYKIVYNAKQ